jgi:1-acyl-sn-glycerol-3-phosphate acyltransferase
MSQKTAERDLVYPFVIFAIKLFWKFLGIQFTFEGVSNVPRKSGAVLAINHVGYLDFALSGTGLLPLKRYIRFMAKKEIFNHKIAGPLMRGMHHISVDRENGAQSFVAAMRELRKGQLVGIFPEATISQSFELKEMKTGAVRLAMGAQVPIIPTIVWGSQRIMTKGHKPNFSRSHIPVFVFYGEPLIFTKGEDVEQAEKLLKSRMQELLEKVQDRYPDNHRGAWWAPVRLGGTAPRLEDLP